MANRQVLNDILRLLLRDRPLSVLLDEALSATLSLPWLNAADSGGILLQDTPRASPALIASRNLGEDFSQHLLNAGGGFIPGSREVRFSGPEEPDDEHARFAPYYVAAILDDQEDILGALVVFAGPGHTFDRIEAELLRSIADVLASLILRMKLEERLTATTTAAESALVELAAHENALDSHAIVAATDVSGTIIYVNDKFCEISGYERDELIGNNHRILNSGHHPKTFFRDMYRTVAQGDSWRGEICNRAKDGSFYWVDTTITPYRDADGKIRKYVSIRTDITARKETEQTLQHNNDLLTSIFQNFPGGISVYSQDLKLQAANPSFYRLMDVPEDIFPIGSGFEDLIRFNTERGEYLDDDPDRLAALSQTLEHRFAKHAFKRCRPDGTTLQIRVWPLPEGGFVSSYVDISDLEDMVRALEAKSSEAIATAKELRQSRDSQERTHQRLITSVNSMRNGLVIWGQDDRMVLANEAYLAFHEPIRDLIVPGLHFEDFLRTGFDAGIWVTGDADREEWIGEIMKGRRASLDETETEILLHDGRQVVANEHRMDNGDIITTIVDVTAHRHRVKELQQTKRRLEQMAYYDGLTGLPNRASCQNDLGRRFAATRRKSPFAMIQIDLDNFKRVNDTLGHAAGDRLLQTLGKRLKLLADDLECFHPYRWGGDEFIALVTLDGSVDLDALCQELTDLVSVPLKIEDTMLRPTVSLGVAKYPEDATDLESLMIFADLALYRTKELGRDGYQFFNAEMKDKIDSEARLEQEIRLAIESGEMELYYQPQLDARTAAITGVEALLRWNHSRHGLISPGTFMSVVEDCGLASSLGREVFEQGFAAARVWRDMGLEFGRLAVNLSPEHLARGEILDDFFKAQERHGIGPEHLAVEFLESFVLDDPDRNVSGVLTRLRERGVHVELDDFGTGYATLLHLSTMPITGLKIDKSFIARLLDSAKYQSIVSSLVTMGQMLRLRVVAEGIETAQQLSALKRIGDCSIQGYFVTNPLSFSDMTEWMVEKYNIGCIGSMSGHTRIAS